MMSILIVYMAQESVPSDEILIARFPQIILEFINFSLVKNNTPYISIND